MRYRLKTPLGPLHVLNVHPVSPRNGLEEARGDGLLQGLRQGRFGSAEGIAVMQGNSYLRQRQIEEIATEAARSPHPTVIAGDTNLPEGSWIYRRSLEPLHRRLRRGGPRLRLHLPGQPPLDAHRPHPGRPTRCCSAASPCSPNRAPTTSPSMADIRLR